MMNIVQWLFQRPRAGGQPPVRPDYETLTLLQLHNAYRRLPLEIDTQLCRAAEEHASSMFNRGVLDHKDFFHRAGRWNFRAENVAWGVEHSIDCFELWWRSPKHRSIMMNPYLKLMGYAKAGLYWCAVYA